MNRNQRLSAGCAMILGCALLVGCGAEDDGVAPFGLQVNSRGVVQTAVHQVEILMRPESLDQRFQMVPEDSFFDGRATTRISAAGEFVILLSESFVAERARTDSTTSTFILDVPLRPTVTTDDPTIPDPKLEVTFIRNGERIAVGERLLPWPLPSGQSGVVTVECIYASFSAQCTNNDPPMRTDAGVPGDGG